MDWNLAATSAFVACLGSTLFMTGLIWFVQVVHYPLFGRVARHDADAWRAYHAAHCRLTGYVVFGPMVVELLSAAWLVFGSRPKGMGFSPAGDGLLAALVTWGVTGLASMPDHNRLASGFDAATHGRLVRLNVLRTIAWTYHAGILLWVAWKLLNGQVAMNGQIDV